LSITLPLLHANQIKIKEEFAAGQKRFGVICCGRRFGKDILSIDLLIEMALEGYPVAWFQPTYKSLLEVWRACKTILKPLIAKGGLSQQDKRIELITGGVIDFWSLDGDPEACRGRKYRRVIVNEAAKVRYLKIAWQEAIMATLGDYNGDAFFPSTPRGRDYYWEMWFKGTERGQLDPDNSDWISWQMPSSSNPKMPLTKDGLTYTEFMRKQLPSDTFSQEILAQFLEQGGRFLEDFEATTTDKVWDEKNGCFTTTERPWHVIPPRKIESHWKKWGAVDYGVSTTHKTFCFLLFAIDEHGVIYVVDEVYEMGLLAQQQASAILKCLSKHDLARPISRNEPNGKWQVDLRLIPMDWASTFPPKDRDQSLGKFPSEYYTDRGLYVQPAVKDREAGWDQVKHWLHNTRVINTHGGEEMSMPMIRFYSNCANLIRTIPLIIRDTKKTRDIEQVPKQEDHLCFVAGTLVTTARGAVPIEDVQVGDYALTRAGFRRVDFAQQTQESALVQTVTLSDGSALTGTPDHPVWIDSRGGWTDLRNLAPGDRVVADASDENPNTSIPGDDVHVISVSTRADRADVYGLAVDDQHEYFANGVLVSNCDTLRYGLMTRPSAAAPPPMTHYDSNGNEIVPLPSKLPAIFITDDEPDENYYD
jgi:hypothetical protein